MILAGPLGIEAQLELLVPVEGVAGTAEFIVAIAGTRAVTSDVGRMGSNLVSDEALAHVLCIREAQVLLRGDVAKHRRAMPTGHRSANGGRDMVVTGGDVGHQGPKHVEGRLIALLHLLFHVELDLVHRHVARAFHHHLHVVFPGPAGEFTEGFQFSQLSGIRGIVLTTRTQ